MPRFPSVIREELPLHVWDSFTPREVPYEQSAPFKLFKGSNVGNVFRSNQQASDYIFSTDYHLLVLNWYARSNIEVPQGEDTDLHRAWDAWTKLSIVGFWLGSMPILQTNLYELLNRKSGSPLLGNVRLATVPPRANCYVSILDSRPARTRLIEAMPWPETNPFEVVWIHLEGVAQIWADLEREGALR